MADVHSADILIMPYNYILSPVIRSKFGINIENNILLIDEAHNISKSLEDSFKFDISTK